MTSCAFCVAHHFGRPATAFDRRSTRFWLQNRVTCQRDSTLNVRRILITSGTEKFPATVGSKGVKMAIKLIVDSCCDTTAEIRDDLNLAIAPLKIQLSSGKEFEDTLDLDIHEMLDEMKESSSVKTNCPSVTDYAKYMYDNDECFVITLASFLSGSYNSAVAARDMVLEEHPDKKIYVFDSLSASAGELRILLYIKELIDDGLAFEEIIPKVESYIDRMCTMFVLEDLGNMIKNGRMSRLAERLAVILNIHPVLYKRRIREIKMAAKVRGLQNAMKKMVNLACEWMETKKPKSLVMTLSHCEVPERAQSLKEYILDVCPAIKDVVIAPTSGLSAVYANRGGIVLAFEADEM